MFPKPPRMEKVNANWSGMTRRVRPTAEKVVHDILIESIKICTLMYIICPAEAAQFVFTVESE